MIRDRLYINKRYRPLINELKEKNVIGFNDAENKEIFLIAVAFGVKKPTPLQNKDGLVRTSYLKISDKALLSSLLLSMSISNDDIDNFSDIDKNIEFSEECAESGFQRLEELVINSSYDSELLSKKLLFELELLYQTNVINI